MFKSTDRRLRGGGVAEAEVVQISFLFRCEARAGLGTVQSRWHRATWRAHGRHDGFRSALIAALPFVAGCIGCGVCHQFPQAFLTRQHFIFLHHPFVLGGTVSNLRRRSGTTSWKEFAGDASSYSVMLNCKNFIASQSKYAIPCRSGIASPGHLDHRSCQKEHSF